MAAFAGINSTADSGIVKSVSSTKVRVQVMGTPNPAASGVTLFVDYTKGPETSITLTATAISPRHAHATNEYSFDSSITSTPAALTKTLTATGKWMWAIATPNLADMWVVITLSSSGSAMDSTSVLGIKAALDTVYGS